jgi:hypothetical protein
LAESRKIKVSLIAAKTLRIAVVGDIKATKHETTEILAKTYPVELVAKLPPLRGYCLLVRMRLTWRQHCRP